LSTDHLPGRLLADDGRTERTRHMGDQLDVPLEDSELLEEVEMVSTLILAASENDDPLDQAAIDRILGVADEDDA
jgi:hypothetical protein